MTPEQKLQSFLTELDRRIKEQGDGSRDWKAAGNQHQADQFAHCCNELITFRDWIERQV